MARCHTHTPKNTLPYMGLEYVTIVEPENMWRRIARTKTVVLFLMPFNRWCTADDNSVEKLQHMIITEWDKLSRGGSLTALNCSAEPLHQTIRAIRTNELTPISLPVKSIAINSETLSEDFHENRIINSVDRTVAY